MFPDTSGIQHKITFNVTKVESSCWDTELTAQNLARNEYLIAYTPPMGSLHAVYVESYSAPGRLFDCINSWPNYTRPQVPQCDVKILYRVSFTCEELPVNAARLRRQCPGCVVV